MLDHSAILADLMHLKHALVRVLAVFLFLVLASFAVPLGFYTFGDYRVPLPHGGGETLSTLLMERIQADLAPEGVIFVTASPLDPFTTKATLSFVAALSVVFPLILLEVFLFVRPGLYPRERRALFCTLIAAVALFFAGAFFAYTLVIPLIFNALFAYLPTGIVPYYSIRELISLVLGLTTAISFVFLLPVTMVLLSANRLVPAHFWRAYARHAILLVLVLSAIITPDGSGISMLLLAIPILILYALGYGGSLLLSKR